MAELDRTYTDPRYATPVEDGDSTPINEILEALQPLLYRWWLVVAAGIVAAAVAGFVHSTRDPIYTAEAMMQVTPGSPLVAVGLSSGGPATGLDVTSQIEIVRSRTVLASVVDSLGLQLQLAERRRFRTQLLGQIDVSPSAGPGSFELALDNENLVLRDPRRDRSIIARARPGEWLEAPGLRLRVASVEPLRSGPVTLLISERERAIESLRGRIRAEPGKGPDLLRIRFSDPDPVFAARVVNSVAASFKEARARAAREAASQRRAFLAEQLVQLADSLRRAQEQLLAYQEKERLLDPRAEGGALVPALLQTDNELRTLRFQEGLLQSLVVSLRSDSRSLDGLQRILVVGQDLIPGGAQFYSRLQNLEEQRSKLTASRFGYTEAVPEVEVLDSLIADTRAQIRSLAQQSLSLVRQRRFDLEERLDELRQQVGTIPQRSAEFTRLEQRVAAVENIFNLIVGKYYEAQIAEAIQTGDVDLVDPAAAPIRPDAGHRGLVLTIAFVIAALAMAIGILVWSNLDPRIHSTEQVERVTRLPAVGVIPHFSDKDGDGASQLTQLEAYRSLVVNIRFSCAEPQSMIAITSAVPGEGKSTVAANVAVALHQHGARVLLIDADLRRPSVHRVFEVEQSPGLSEAVLGDVGLEHAVRRHPVYGIDLLTCGTSIANPPALFGGERFARLLAELRNRYDCVVVDTPPILAVTDPAVICAQATGTLFVVRANQTDRFAVATALEQLRRSKVPLLGVVLSDVVFQNGSYGYAKYRYYKYSSYYTEDRGGKHAGRQRDRRPPLLVPMV